jgi:Protein of unknown function (DUF1826)
MAKMNGRLAGLFLLVCWLQFAAWTVESFVEVARTDGLTKRPANRFFCRHIMAATSQGTAAVSSYSTGSFPWSSENETFKVKPYYVYHSNNHIDEEAWQRLCPESPKKNDIFLPVPFRHRQPQKQKPVDVTKIWSLKDNPQEVAADLIRDCWRLHNGCDNEDDDCASSHSFMDDLLVPPLAESLDAYLEFCKTHLLDNSKREGVRLKCRLVATTGPSGAKCPQYHIDQVPVRWIQTFVGPGVELVVGNKGVKWDAFARKIQGDEADEQLDVVSWTPDERNLQLVDADAANLFRAQAGEAVLMLGNEWNERIQTASPNSSVARVQPVVHKSPKVSATQPRVLLTQDILFDATN